MTAYTNIVINDRESTPVAHTFVPNGKNPPTFKEAGETVIGRNTLTVTSEETQTKRKVKINIVMPVVQTETVNGIDDPKIVRWNTAVLNFTFDVDSPLQERKNLVGLAYGALAADQTELDDVLTQLGNYI